MRCRTPEKIESDVEQSWLQSRVLRVARGDGVATHRVGRFAGSVNKTRIRRTPGSGAFTGPAGPTSRGVGPT